MSRIVLATMGSLGDLHPYLAVGVALKERGHDVLIATAEDYRSKIESLGLAFHPIGPDFTPQAYDADAIERAHDLKKGTAYLLRALVLPNVERTYRDLLDACEGADLFCIHPILFPAPTVAEKLGLKWVSVILAPGAFVSAHDPPVLPPVPWLHALRHCGPLPNRLVFDLFRKMTRHWMRPIDELRKREGLALALKHPIHNGMFSPCGTLALFSKILGTAQPDWPPNTVVTGFTFHEERGQDFDPALERFLNDGPPPVVFTLGSSAVWSSGSFYQESVKAVRLLGCRAVFLVGRDAPSRIEDLGPGVVFYSSYAPYSRLFPRAAAAVHSGGIGTTAEAMRAGLPMLVVPYAHDQPDNAYRVSQLGIARVLSRARYTGDAAAAHLRQLLSRPEYAERARQVRAKISQEDALKTACEMLEGILNQAH